MATEKKVKIVEDLREIFSRSSIGIITDYRGLMTSELNEIRRILREAHVEYRVVKNSLAQLAAKNAGMDHIVSSFQGPVAVAFGHGESLEAAKVLADYVRASKSNLSIKGGFLADRVLSARDVETLARTPPKEVLIAQLMARMQSPIFGLVSVLAGPIRGVMGVLQARIRQLEGA